MSSPRQIRINRNAINRHWTTDHPRNPLQLLDLTPYFVRHSFNERIRLHKIPHIELHKSQHNNLNRNATHTLIRKKKTSTGHRCELKENPSFQREDLEYWTVKFHQNSNIKTRSHSDIHINLHIRVCWGIYLVQRGIEGVFWDQFLQASPERRGWVLNGERNRPIPSRHCCFHWGA